jgi:hypothetical protein
MSPLAGITYSVSQVVTVITNLILFSLISSHFEFRQNITLIFILIISSNLRLGLICGLIPLGFTTINSIEKIEGKFGPVLN